MAKIIPMFKQDDDTDVNNYRLIALLSNFNRIFEKNSVQKKGVFYWTEEPAHSISIWLLQDTFYSACNTDKYEQLFILMRDFHWSEKGFWDHR